MMMPRYSDTWEKRDRFEGTLLRNAWTLRRTLKRSTIFEKGGLRLEVDDFGLFIWTWKKTEWERTHGCSFDRIDAMYRPGKEGFALKVQEGSANRRLDLVKGEWVN